MPPSLSKPYLGFDKPGLPRTLQRRHGPSVESLPVAKALGSTTRELLVKRLVRSNRVLVLRRKKNHLDGRKEPGIVALVSVVPGTDVVDGVELAN